AKNKAASIDDRFVQLSNVSSPIIFEAARASQVASFDSFKTHVANNPRSYANGILTYRSLNGTNFVFGTAPSKVNGAPIDYAPPSLFASPFVNSTWGSGRITISKDSMSAIYDFSDKAHPVRFVG